MCLQVRARLASGSRVARNEQSGLAPKLPGRIRPCLTAYRACVVPALPAARCLLPQRANVLASPARWRFRRILVY